MSSLLGKHVIAANPADLVNGDSIASYLVGAAGALLTSSLVGAKQALDVADLSDYATNATSAAGDIGGLGLAIRHDADTTIATASGNYAPLQLDANGALKVSGTLTATFTAEHNEDAAFTNGDSGIATLLVRQDTLATSTSADADYGSFKSNALGELYVHDTSALAELVLLKGDTASIVTNTGTTASNTGTIVTNTGTIATNTGTTATNTGTIASTLTALSKAEDAAAASGDQGIMALAVRKDALATNVSADGDYSSLITWSEGSLKVVDVANIALLQQQVSVTSTAALVPAAALANRRSIMIQNTGSVKMYVGSATVTTTGATTGIELPANSFLELEAGPTVPVYVVKAGAGSATLNVLEMA